MKKNKVAEKIGTLMILGLGVPWGGINPDTAAAPRCNSPFHPGALYSSAEENAGARGLCGEKIIDLSVLEEVRAPEKGAFTGYAPEGDLLGSVQCQCQCACHCYCHCWCMCQCQCQCGSCGAC
ncbi:MAG: hypothetical protein RDV48_27715 [Candidatus Eremiobacteraeota bacterium]|nr:hypothetical protein [Candidatus Eremiobacteraeota bacterium]